MVTLIFHGTRKKPMKNKYFAMIKIKSLLNMQRHSRVNYEIIN